ncbi:MAG: NTP transferase domain-containing protein [Paramuribaculum sp.]|nr:NTP transferase domain-containing protein [Paramuribaculum sp.]
MNYAILAGGQGSRFVKDGVQVPKPLVKILGRTMLQRLIELFMDNGAERITVSANANMPMLMEALEQYVKMGFPVEVRPIVTDNSFISLQNACRDLGDKFIATTVDAMFINSEFGDFVKAFEKMDSKQDVLMGLTRFVDDPSPLYADLDSDGLVIDYRYGGRPFKSGTIVSAGIYGLTPESFKAAEKVCPVPESLSDFQRILAAETPLNVKVFEFSKAFDVDCVHDVSVAEEFLSAN